MSRLTEIEERHPATADAWAWLEHGEGRGRTPEDRERIAALLRETDEELHKLDALHPDPGEEANG